MALVELFRETGQQRYRETAEFFLDRRGHGVLHAERGVNPSYYSDRVPVREATSVEGHAVRAIYLAAGATDRAIEDGNAEHLAQQEARSEEHTSELQSRGHLVCRLLLEKKNHGNISDISA